MTETGATAVPGRGETMDNEANLLISQAFAYKRFGRTVHLIVPHVLYYVTQATKIDRKFMEVDLVITMT